MLHPTLTSQLAGLARELPSESLTRLAELLSQDPPWPRLHGEVEQVVAHPASRARLHQLLHEWQHSAPQLSASSLALAFEAAAATAQTMRHEQQLELVWTGPDTRVIPLRRSDQALLEVIRSAEHTLHIVSFAVYKIPAVAEALIERAKRGVRLAIYLETPEASQGKMAYSTVQALGEEVGRRAQLYIWPRTKRPLGSKGKPAALHAKLALADDHTLLLTSANLTAYALTLNMEMGVLVRGGTHPRQVAMHLKRLVEQGEFTPL